MIDPTSGRNIFLFAVMIFMSNNNWQSVLHGYILCIACGMLGIIHVSERTSTEFAGVDIGLFAMSFVLFIALSLRLCSMSFFCLFYEHKLLFLESQKL